MATVLKVAKVHYSYGAGEPSAGFVDVQCGAHVRTNADLWSTDVVSEVTCGSCLRLVRKWLGGEA